MNLANAYADVIRSVPEKDAKAYVPKLMAFMKSRGHLSILPEVVRILERSGERSDRAVVTVAKQPDEAKFSRQIREALAALGAGEHRVHVDPRSVGGWSVRAGSKLVDRSFRTSLVSLYKKAAS